MDNQIGTIWPVADTKIVKKCSCGIEYTLEEFRKLENLGTTDMRSVDDQEPTFCEYRNCTCRSTMVLERAKDGSVWERD